MCRLMLQPERCRSALSKVVLTSPPHTALAPGPRSIHQGGSRAGSSSTGDTRLPSSHCTPRLPPQTADPRQHSALHSSTVVHHVTFSSCSLFSSSIFLRNRAPLTVSSLERRGALGTSMGEWCPTAAHGAMGSLGRGCRQDGGCPNVPSTPLHGWIQQLLWDEQSHSMGKRCTSQCCVSVSVALLLSTRRFHGFQQDHVKLKAL